MNKQLTFTSGGQPVYLDDLQTLQNQIVAALRFIQTWTGATLVADKFKIVQYMHEMKEKYVIDVQECNILYNGEIYHLEETRGLEVNVELYYIHLTKEVGDQRVFRNGTTEYTTQRLVAKIVRPADDNDYPEYEDPTNHYYKVTSIKNLKLESCIYSYADDATQ